jgi:hypothetical protein
MSRSGYDGFRFPGFDPDDLLVALDAGFSDEEIVYVFALDDDARHRAPEGTEVGRCSGSSPADGRKACQGRRDLPT